MQTNVNRTNSATYVNNAYKYELHQQCNARQPCKRMWNALKMRPMPTMLTDVNHTKNAAYANIANKRVLRQKYELRTHTTQTDTNRAKKKRSFTNWTDMNHFDNANKNATNATYDAS